MTYNFIHPPTEAGACRAGGWGSYDAFRTPPRGVPTQQSQPVLHFALEQQGEAFETSCHSGSFLARCFAPLSTWYRPEGPEGSPSLTNPFLAQETQPEKERLGRLQGQW